MEEYLFPRFLGKFCTCANGWNQVFFPPVHEHRVRGYAANNAQCTITVYYCAIARSSLWPYCIVLVNRMFMWWQKNHHIAYRSARTEPLYQYKGTVAFLLYNTNTNLTIDDAYVDGVSITYGNTPRKHIWTYGWWWSIITIGNSSYDCPCKQNSTTVPPPYVGIDYYCESGVCLCCPPPYFYIDPLWDGQLCGGGEPPCCTHPNMPWFIKTFNESTTEDIELRLCKDKLLSKWQSTRIHWIVRLIKFTLCMLLSCMLMWIFVVTSCHSRYYK